jgi:ABC-type multidrug transport system permease subunit
MLGVLLAKDLIRAWRNPLPWLINLVMPLVITALIGLAFGTGQSGASLGRIRFAIVDEDDSPLTGFLRGAMNQGPGAQHLEPVFLDRQSALRQLNADQLSAVVIIPPHFTRDYLTARREVTLQLIKNPAQSIAPAVLEELMGALVTGLNTLSRNFQAQFPEWRQVLEGHRDYRQVAALIEREGDRLRPVWKYVYPPLISYEKDAETRTTPSGPAADRSHTGATLNLFGYLLAGMTGMFLLFLASTGLTDLNREVRQRTFERYHTLRQQLLPFVVGKVVFTVVLLLISGAVMLGGGALVFRIHWAHPLGVALVTACYACFAACLMAVLVALVPDERRANVINSLAAMMLGIGGGCAFPPEQLPALLRQHLTPLLPPYWFTQTLRANTGFLSTAVALLLLSAAMVGLSAFLFRRRFKAGLSA